MKSVHLKAKFATLSKVRRPPVILIVDDEEHVRLPIASMFEEAGFEVLQANSGMAAIMILQDRPHVDAMFTDVVMPSAPDGYKLAEFVHATNPGCVIILTSGMSCPLPGVLNSRTEFIPKPYNGNEVIARINALIRANTAESFGQAVW